MAPTVAVFGLGEAGSLIAADLAGAGAEVRGYDPADVSTPPGVGRHHDPRAAVQKVDLVIAVTAAADAQAAIAQAWDSIARGTVYADLSTAPPTLKQDLADTATLRGLRFADVALMATVPGKGLGTPSFASGTGAQAYADLVNPLGGNVEVVGDNAGEAATRKLLRSVVMKGLAALVIEAMQAGAKVGEDRWLWDHLGDQLAVADESLLMRLVAGTGKHSRRRHEEMEEAASMLEQLDVEPLMTRATAESLRRIDDAGMPDIGESVTD